MLFFFFLFADVVSELLSVTIFSRHGERASHRDSPYFDPSPGVDNAELTPHGFLQHFSLGQRIRTHYSSEKLLSDTFLPHEVYVRASNLKRTILSAQSQINGYFANGIGDDKIMSYPVQTDLHSEDFIFIGFENCPYPQSYTDNLENLPEYKSFVTDAKSSFDKASSLPGAGTIDQTNFEALIYEMGAKEDHVDLSDQEKLVLTELREQQLKLWKLKFHYSDPKWERASIGLTFGELFYANINADLEEHPTTNQASNEESPYSSQRRVRLYVGHDSSVFTILQSLGYEQTHAPLIGASIVVELHSNKTSPFFRFFYLERIGHDVSKPLKPDLIPFTPKGCPSEDCPVKKFQDFWRNQTYLPSTREDYLNSACEYVPSYVPASEVVYKGMNTATAFVILCLDVILLMGSVWTAVMLSVRRHNLKRDSFHKLQDI
ncbi:hypothetical protein BLNAU_4635 [Blattamonas nauphoetae]|uniref:Acid phosphatase n=1 Tax=Blattamonas nauphoetae TaxID=2049346 RepID=A0ABQ9Y9H9_9EUKA|nr:hypothetical protein BLNAU_4635 [Blattamonas nauphoetae]